MANGTTTLNFGAFPGTLDTSVTVTGQASIGAGSLVEAWLLPVATADHGVDEHLVENIKVIAGTITAGAGFVIYGYATLAQNGITEPLYGQYTVAWAWA